MRVTVPYTSTATISIHAPHGVRPSKLHIHQIPFAISIHAPHGVRLRRAGAKSWMALFQSTRHTGCDSICISSLYQKYGFQSTRHTGRDVSYANPSPPRPYFNPRATRGATPATLMLPVIRTNFNQRATRGATSSGVSGCTIASGFQSTRHTGRDFISLTRD